MTPDVCYDDEIEVGAADALQRGDPVDRLIFEHAIKRETAPVHSPQPFPGHVVIKDILPWIVNHPRAEQLPEPVKQAVG